MTATLSGDFLLMGSCVQSHDHWCVTFSANQTEVSCSVFALPDSLLEETESVFFQLLPRTFLGTLGQQTVLNITIVDRTEREFCQLFDTLVFCLFGWFTFHIYSVYEIVTYQQLGIVCSFQMER